MVRTINIIHKENPIEGDLGVGEDGTMFCFRNGNWKKIEKIEESALEYTLQKKRKAMYEKGITNYRTKEGIKMTIREDGTEYIDKCDMPA